MFACSSKTVHSKHFIPGAYAQTPSEACFDRLVTARESGKTRLNAEYIREALLDREGDAELSAEFDAFVNDQSEAHELGILRRLEGRFILDPSTSVVDLLGPEFKEHFRDFAWEENDYPGGPEGANETWADVMVDALDLIRPERRANTGVNAVVVRAEASEPVWEYMTAQWVKVPGQEEYMLNRHAAESFVRMHEAAKAEGVDLVILSAHRLRKVAEENAAKAANPNAVASFSAHSLGLAVDFKMSHGEQEFKEISTRPMDNVVKMRESAVHKWLFLRGAEFGWFPYQNEPWHWEYNPIGFRNEFWLQFPGGAPNSAEN